MTFGRCKPGWRRLLLACVVTTSTSLLAAGCASGGSSSGDSPQGTASGGQSAAGQTHYALTITQPDGSTATLKAAPTRIVTVGNPSIAMDNVVALGIKPIGGEVYDVATDPSGYDAYDSRGIPKEIATQITSFTPVGSPTSNPDLETIASLKPDLIVGVNGPTITDLKQLEAIAPVVSPGNTYPAGDGIDSLSSVTQVQLLGKILNRQAEATAFVNKLADAADTVRAAVSGKTVDLVTPGVSNSGFFWFGADAQPTGHFLSFLGLKLQTSFPAGGKMIVNSDYMYSMEHADLLNAQYLVLGVQPSLYSSFLANPVVQRLPAVKAGRVIQTQGSSEGFGGNGFLIAGAIGQLNALTGIEKAFTTTGQTP